MTFWSTQKLQERFQDLISIPNSNSTIVDALIGDMIDCNAITLTVGPELYLSGDKDDHRQEHQLDFKAHATIPPGKFAYIITEEVVHVPTDAMAFISFKAKYKFKGLINVSGFHVDPGWSGRLVFSLFNAGPNPISVQRGDPFFLIWYADLSENSSKNKEGTNCQLKISSSLVDNINQDVPSPSALEKRMVDLESKLSNEIQKSRLALIGGFFIFGMSVFSPIIRDFLRALLSDG
jgi:dCTP deaminase